MGLRYRQLHTRGGPESALLSFPVSAFRFSFESFGHADERVREEFGLDGERLEIIPLQ